MFTELRTVFDREKAHERGQIFTLDLFACCAVLFVMGAGTAHAQAPDRVSIKMTAPLEVGVSVRDALKLAEYYTNVLGFTKISETKTPPEMSRQTGASRDGYLIVRLQTPYGERIKLAQIGSTPEKVPPPQYVMARQGLAYLTFIVDDLDGIITRLRKAQAKMMFDGRKVEVRPGIFALYTYDPEDNVLEFVQFADIATYRPDIYPSGSQPKKP